jgi:hypothetical protein
MRVFQDPNTDIIGVAGVAIPEEVSYTFTVTIGAQTVCPAEVGPYVASDTSFIGNDYDQVFHTNDPLALMT